MGLQFIFRWPFSVVTTFVLLLAGMIAVGQLKLEQGKEAYRQAVRDGRMLPEDAGNLLGDEVDILKTELERPGK